MRKFFSRCLIGIFCASFLLPVAASAYTPTTDFYMNDYAGILSSETEEFVMQNSVKLAAATKAQIVVVTINSLDGKSIESYATELFRDYGIGDKELNNGVLLLVSYGDHKMRIEVGYGLEGALPDGKCGRIRDNYILPYFREDKYDEGVLNGYKAIFAEVAKEYSYDSEADMTAFAAQTKNDDDDDWFAFGFMAKMFASVFAFAFVNRNSSKKKKIIWFVVLEALTIGASMVSMSIGAKGWWMLLIAGTLTNLVIIKLATLTIPGSSSGHGWSSGGWSSGGSSGGGGGGYSGGGGSSGGGGASGSW